MTKDVSEFTQQSHRAKNGNIYDGATIFKRSATAPISSVTETHAVETYENNFKPELSSQTTTSKTSGGYRSSLELKGNYTQINRDAAGLRQGATTGNYWSLTSQETNLGGENGGPSSVTASWNMDSPNTTVELKETLSSSFNSMMTTENTYTADNGSLTSKSAYADLAWGTSDTKTNLNGVLDGSGNQLSGTQTVQNDDESEGTFWRTGQR